MGVVTPIWDAFPASRQMIPLGVISLRHISRFLVDLPDDAKGLLLVSPQPIHDLVGDNTPLTFDETIEAFPNLNARAQIHYRSEPGDQPQILTGINYDLGRTVSREQVTANEIRATFERAAGRGVAQLTPLFVATAEMTGGICMDMEASKSEIECHFREGINFIGVRQRSARVPSILDGIEQGNYLAYTHYVVNEPPISGCACSVDLRDGSVVHSSSDGSPRSSSYPMAVLVYPA